MRSLAALAMGVLLAGAVLMATTGDHEAYVPIVAWGMGSLVVSLLIAGVITGIWRLLPLSLDRTEALLAQGLGSPARLESLERTGTSVNGVPLWLLHLVVAPHDRPPYRTTSRLLIDPVAMPWFEPGTVLVVARYRVDAPEVAVVRKPDADWQRRVRAEAHRIPAAGQVAEWKSTGRPAVRPVTEGPFIGLGRLRPAARFAIYAMATVLGAGAVLGLNIDAF